MGFIEGPRRVVRPAAGPGAAPGRSTAPAPPAGSPALSRDRYQDRTRELMDSVRRLDAGLNEAAVRELSGWIREQYATSYGDVPVGFVAVCRLGPPFVDHRLSLFHTIIDHFAPGDPMPEPFAAARMLVRSRAYEYVEVYAGGTVLPVLDDGSVVRP
ncbi:hypothetical protein ACIRQP_04045 [Streptomyces sp. NPDC102274]|uniref:hypothetical protein n=1 Tax=Streptomyces sp. NPDC102274 TaxID=3366151 RepID=UPI0038011EFF